MLRLVKLRLARDSAFMNTQKNYLYPKNGYVLNFSHFNSLFTSSTLELPHEEVTISIFKNTRSIMTDNADIMVTTPNAFFEQNFFENRPDLLVSKNASYSSKVISSSSMRNFISNIFINFFKIYIYFMYFLVLTKFWNN